MFPTRALSPADFPAGVPPLFPSNGPAVDPRPPAPATDDVRIAALISGLKAARARLDTGDAAQIQSAWRQIALQIGYLIGLLESKGHVVPPNTVIPDTGEVRTALDELIAQLEGAVEPTRLAPIFFLAGMFVGVLLSRAL